MRRVLVTAVTMIGLAVAAGRAEEIVRGDIGKRVDEYLTRLTTFGFSGAVLVANGRDVLLKKGYGLANRDRGTRFTADTVSSIGSITKQFTAAAMLKLEMLGRLKVEDPISKHLPDVPADKASITIHQLLTHTAGIPEDLGGADSMPIGRDELVRLVMAAPLSSKPGTRFEYSNEGYSLAGAIVERVSGQPYEAFLREQLFLPLGMKDTGYQIPAWPVERLAVGYRADGMEWGLIYKRGWRADGPGWHLRANGGIHSTLDDLFAWHLALDSDKVLSAAARKKFLSGHVDAGGPEKYAYGWGVTQSRRKTPVISHNGGNGIYAADFRRYAGEGLVIVAMTNTPVVPATRLAPRELESLVFNDRPVVMPPQTITVDRLPAFARKDATGHYAFGDGAFARVTMAREGLLVDTNHPQLLAALLGLSAATPGGRFSDVEDRSRLVLESASKGDFRPIFDAFDDNRSFEQVSAAQTRLWSEWGRDLGTFIGLDVIGTMLEEGDPTVVVRLRFSRGSPIVHLRWGPRRLFAFRVNAESFVLVRPESTDTYVCFSYGQAAPVRFTFRERSVQISGQGLAISGQKPLI